ncbi:MAG: hypothetical protein OHK0039_22620 [Bacteroidia bacterium]
MKIILTEITPRLAQDVLRTRREHTLLRTIALIARTYRISWQEARMLIRRALQMHEPAHAAPVERVAVQPDDIEPGPTPGSTAGCVHST